MNNNKVALPAWWPACPYPADIFPMDLERYAELVPDPEQRTALSGALGRHFWEIASAEILRRYAEERRARLGDALNVVIIEEISNPDTPDGRLAAWHIRWPAVVGYGSTSNRAMNSLIIALANELDARTGDTQQ